jgi:cytochrome c biogenesis protein CcmG, thiol:disulfide interchange protein DsbE
MTTRLKLGAQALAVALVLALLALLIWKVANQNGGGVATKIDHGKIAAAPNFTLDRLGSTGTLELSALRGKAVVLNFWASWCLPCNQEAPALEAASHRYGDKAVVLGIDVRDASGEARKFVRKHGLSYSVLHDNHDVTWPKYGLTGLPETFFVDARGRVVGHVTGQVSPAELRDGTQEALRA